jgi:hypothetical protein
VPPSEVSLTLYALRGTAANDTEHTPALLTLGTTISTGLAVAQKMEHTSGTFRIAFKTLMGYAFWMSSTKTWPQPNARALRMAVSRSPSSFPSTRVKQAPELSLNANPNLACGTVVLTASYKSSTVLMKCD